MSTPVVLTVRVVPVAGRDGMLLNLSGAHAPFFTRNLLIVQDSSGHTGVGEVPGGERIRQTLEDARPLVEGQPIDNFVAPDALSSFDKRHLREAFGILRAAQASLSHRYPLTYMS